MYTNVMPKLISIDPGDRHVGVAFFEGEGCSWALNFTPSDAMDFLLQEVPGVDVVVVERYQLYPHLAQLQQGSDMRTSQMIGAIKVVARMHGVPVVIQPAAFKKAAESLIKHRGIVRKSLGHGDHAKDAETHGYTYLWKTKNKQSVIQDALDRSETDLFGS